MDKREKIIRLWFDMWLQKKDLGIEGIFSADALYIESWGPQYQGVAKVKHWFEEWNTRGTVLQWDIKQYFHKENQCQRQFEIVRKRRRNFVVFRRGGQNQLFPCRKRVFTICCF